MKTFVCALITFALIVAAVIVNGLFFARLTEDAEENIENAADASLPLSIRAKMIENIEKGISDNAFLISLTVGHDEINALYSYVSDARRQITRDEGQSLAALDKLKREIERLRMTECICIDGTF